MNVTLREPEKLTMMGRVEHMIARVVKARSIAALLADAVSWGDPDQATLCGAAVTIEELLDEALTTIDDWPAKGQRG